MCSRRVVWLGVWSGVIAERRREAAGALSVDRVVGGARCRVFIGGLCHVYGASHGGWEQGIGSSRQWSVDCGALVCVVVWGCGGWREQHAWGGWCVCRGEDWGRAWGGWCVCVECVERMLVPLTSCFLCCASGMFYGASSFNQPLTSFDTSHVTSMGCALWWLRVGGRGGTWRGGVQQACCLVGRFVRGHR